MTNFNIRDSKVEQLNQDGDNIKLVGNSGNVVVSSKGDVVQSIGDQNKPSINQPKPSLWSLICKKIVAIWLWFKGKLS